MVMNTIKTWCFDLITGEYTGTYNAPKDPKSLGRYQIPAFATEIEPPAPAENQKVVWDGQAWQLVDIPLPEPAPEPTEEDLLQQEISILEGMAHERYDAFVKLMATDAPQEEIDVLKWELQVIIQELEVLRNEA
jgi:hypothetical protein